MTEPLTEEEIVGWRQGLENLQAGGLSLGWHDRQRARALATIDADRERGADFYRLVEEREAGWIRAFRCRQDRIEGLKEALERSEMTGTAK